MLVSMMLSASSAVASPQVFVLGVDGMDPVILERLMTEGRTPNLAALAKAGAFQPLGTVWPPQSPVAWSSFVTGLDPGGHGVFDFVHRDPKTYHPMSSATPPVTAEPRVLELFGYVLPLSSVDAPNNRAGVPFWDLLHDAGVDVEVYRIPGNFPVPESDAKVLSGMGTVDMRGGYGTYTLFTDQLVPGKPKGDIQRVTLQDLDLDGVTDTAVGAIKGPPDVFHLKPGQVPQDKDYLKARLTFHVDPAAETVAIVGGAVPVVLNEGEWSEWVTVSFDALPMGLMPLEGTVRFYAKELRPTFKVYASPVNLSPANTPLPVTSPTDWAEELASALGPFYTQGMPEDTNALKDDTFDDDDYVAQVGLVQADSRTLLRHAVQGFKTSTSQKGALTFVYLSDIDLQCHMLWRHADPKYAEAPPHPARDEAVAHAHADDINRFYEDVDQLVGEVRAALPAGAVLMVMSDHGFQPFTRKVHLNAWLRDRGYLVLKDGKTTGEISADDVDWSKTKAYGLGFNGLYINRVGREAQGIVAEADVAALEAALIGELEALADPSNGVSVVRSVAKARDVYTGARVAEAPDLVVGYDKGYGCSDESTLGGITKSVFANNREKWSGNHLMDPAVVPGVVLTNRAIQGSGHDLMDLTATLLSAFGVAPAPGMSGTPIFPLE